MNPKQLLGSKTAKEGFTNERRITEKFNNFLEDQDAQSWLNQMGYPVHQVDSVIAEVSSGNKTDIRLYVKKKGQKTLIRENIQVKLVSQKVGFNQVDKRWVETYQQRWHLPEKVAKILKYYTGEIPPYHDKVRDSRRMFLNEMREEEQSLILQWFRRHKFLVFSDIFKGRGENAVEWFLIIQKNKEIQTSKLLNINELFLYLDGPVHITKKGNLSIGRNLTMQRKGGDGGRKTASMLQFKCNPLYFLIDIPED